MDQRELGIVASVAAKAATDLVSSGVYEPGTVTLELWESWYRHIGKSMVGTVEKAFPSPPPSAGSTSPVANSQPARRCPQCDGAMEPIVPVEGKNLPAWRCLNSNWDPVRKVRDGCQGVIWPARV